VTITVEGQELQIPEVIQTEVMEIREGRAEAEARVEELEAAHAREQHAAEHLAVRLDDRPTSEDIAALREFAAEFGELIDRHADVVGEFAGVNAEDASDERLAQLRERAQTAEEQVDELEGEVERFQLEATVVDEQFSEKMEFVWTDAVREQIETAAEQAKTNAEHTWDVVFFLADCDEPVGIETILPVVEVAESSVRDILARLKEQHIVFVNTDGRKHTYRLNVNGMETVVEQQRRREEMNDLREEVGVQDA
jgi:DNA repair exonuclease SbcCD ATPase subunit